MNLTTSITGTVINGYEFISFIDSGGFGSVYKAKKDDTYYAIKIFREDYVLKEFREKGDNNRIQREIDIMKSVKHPFLVKYIDDFEDEISDVPSIFLVMELAEGATLKDILNRKELSENEVRKVFSNILLGLQALHEVRGTDEDKGIIHRDLKPANIIVNSNFDIKILDYGISKVIDYTSITSTGEVMGSPVYMSPEQIIDSKHIDKRSDLYTLGVILYEMLTGHLPYDASNLPELYYKIQNISPIPPRRWKSLIDNRLENIIIKLLEKQPYKRYSNINELIYDFSINDIVVSHKIYDLTPRFFLRLWNEKSVLEEYIKRNTQILYVEYPANHQAQQKNLLRLINEKNFVKLIDPATMRLAYSAQSEVKGLQALPYSPPKFNVITPEYLDTNEKKQKYVKQVIDEQIKLGADVLISPYHYIHNTNVPPTQRRNPVAEWFDLDIKLLKESIDYKTSVAEYSEKHLYGGICLNAESLLDTRHKTDLLNLFSSFDCDGFFIYVDCIDNNTNGSILFHYINTLVDLQENTKKPVIAGRLNAIGLGLLCAGITGFSSGAARFESFYEDLYKEESDAYNMYERYYFPELLGTIAISKKSPEKLKSIIDKIGACKCYYCKNKNYIQMIDAPNNKLHFLENIHNEVKNISEIPSENRISYFIDRIETAINNYKKLIDVFKPDDYKHLKIWKDVFEELNKR